MRISQKGSTLQARPYGSMGSFSTSFQVDSSFKTVLKPCWMSIAGPKWSQACLHAQMLPECWCAWPKWSDGQGNSYATSGWLCMPITSSQKHSSSLQGMLQAPSGPMHDYLHKCCQNAVVLGQNGQMAKASHMQLQDGCASPLQALGSTQANCKGCCRPQVAPCMITCTSAARMLM